MGPVQAVLASLVSFSVFASAAPPKRPFPVDESVSPCANFYDYVCRKTIQGFELPKNRSHHNFSFNDTSEYLLEEKKKYFQALLKLKPESARETQLQTYFKACMDEKNARAAEEKYVAASLKAMEAVTTREQFADRLYADFKTGDPSFVEFWADAANSQRPEKMDAYFTVDLLTAPDKSYYDKEEMRADLKSLARRMFESIGLDRADERAGWVADFERDLAKVYPGSQEINERFFAETTLPPKEAKKMKNLRLAEFIAGLPGKPHVRDIFKFQTLAFVDKAVGTLPLDQLKSIWLFTVLKPHLDDAHPGFRKQMTEFQAKHFGGPTERPDRLERCTKETERKFAMELDSILLPRLYPDFPKDKVVAMVEKIRAGLVKSLEKNEWLSPSARKAAALKIKELNIRLVAPESDMEWNFGKEGNYSATDRIGNRLLSRRLSTLKMYEDLTKTFDNPPWPFGPLLVNAALLPSYNAIVFPIAILQPPFYDPAAPEEANMAAIGMVIGHELGHAIDDKGYTYDHKGRVRPWIKKADEKKFLERAKPLVEQFNAAGQNGQFTLGENIGDLVGLTNSYQAAFPAGTEKPSSLKREFFIQYGRVWCEVQKPEVAELRKKTDPHSIGLARVNEQVRQQPGFAEAFACKEGDPMTMPAAKRVRIW